MGKLYVVDADGHATGKMSPYIKVNGEYREIEEIYYGYDNKAVLVYPVRSYLNHFTISGNPTTIDVVLE